MYIFSILLLVLSVTLSFSTIILKNSAILSLKQPVVVKFLNYPLIALLFLSALFIYRKLCLVPKSIFYSFVLANFAIITSFYMIRLNVATQINTQFTFAFYLAFFTLFFISSIFAVSRLFFRIGFILNTQVVENPELILFWEHLTKQSVNVFSAVGKRISGNIPTNPGATGVDRNFALGVGTFCATAVAATSGVYIGYETYQGRLINQRAAETAERALDIQERNSGFMSPAQYASKWEKFGKKRK